MKRRRVLIADDHPMVRDALRLAIGMKRSDLVVEEAMAIEPAERLIRQYGDFCLVLLDYNLPDSHGFSGFLRLQHMLGDVPIALISAQDDARTVNAARAVGAAGFLSKSWPLDEIATAVDALIAGRGIFPITGGVDDSLQAIGEKLESLSPAQRRVVAMLVSGQLNKQIASDLEVSEATVKAHLTAIFRKLGVHNRLQAILAVKPLLDPEPPA